MIKFSELFEKNHQIAEKTKIFLYMIQEREICDTDVTNDLLFDVLDEVKCQMDIEDREFYKKMLTSSVPQTKVTANNFLSSSSAIKREIKQYLKHWTYNNILRIRDHDAFIAESNKMFDMIENHIIMKTEKLYPVVRQLFDEREAA